MVYFHPFISIYLSIYLSIHPSPEDIPNTYFCLGLCRPQSYGEAYANIGLRHIKCLSSYITTLFSGNILWSENKI